MPRRRSLDDDASAIWGIHRFVCIAHAVRPFAQVQVNQIQSSPMQPASGRREYREVGWASLSPGIGFLLETRTIPIPFTIIRESETRHQSFSFFLNNMADRIRGLCSPRIWARPSSSSPSSSLVALRCAGNFSPRRPRPGLASPLLSLVCSRRSRLRRRRRRRRCCVHEPSLFHRQ